jgi:hypothetical protein
VNLDRDHWLDHERFEQVLPPGAFALVDPVGRLQALLDDRARAFAELRFGSGDGIDLRLGRRGLVADEAAVFLRGLDAGLLQLDEVGGVRVRGCRPKLGGGRYSLFTANTCVGDLHVSINLEYLIQLGAVCELLTFHGWPGSDVEVEVGEYDALAHDGERVVLAMEAKARIDGPDSLSALWHSFLDFAAAGSPPDAVSNHSRKYVELLRLTESGPVVVWLVAAQARWATVATRVDSHICFQPADGVDHATVVGLTARHLSFEPARAPEPATVVGLPDIQLPEPPPRPLGLAANVAHALDVGRLTEYDGQPRCYEFPWSDERELDTFALELRRQLRCSDLTHARPWKWRAETSGGSALSPLGRTCGLELRYFYYT